MRGKRVLSIGAIALVVVAGALATGYTVHKHNQCAPNQTNASAGSGHAGPSTGPTVSVIGDSYASGMGLEHPRESWAFDLARSYKMSTTVNAFPGTGYVIGGACGDHSFPTRTSSIHSDASTVIIEGGLNDAIFGTSSSDLRSTAQKLLHDAANRAPKANIVVVGPASPPDVPTASVQRVDEVLRAAAEQGGHDYVDLTGLRFHFPDGTHPDVEGHRLIAASVSDALSAG
jgi:lysophospholipase L1-like esterase